MGSGPSTAPRGVQPAVSHGTTSALTFQDLVTMVEQLARFLGVSCDKAQLESLIEHCHQLVDQCCNAEALPVGRGTRPCRPCLCPGPVAPPPTSVSRCPVSCFSRALCCAWGEAAWKPGRAAVCVVTEQTVSGFPGGPPGTCQALWAPCSQAGVSPDGPTAQSPDGPGGEIAGPTCADGFSSLWAGEGVSSHVRRCGFLHAP